MSEKIHLRGLTWGHTRGLGPLAVLGRVWEDFHPGEKITWDDRSLRSFGEDGLDRFIADYDLIVFDYPLAGAALKHGWVLPLDGLLPSEVLAARREGTVGPGFDAFFEDGHLAGLLIDMATHVSVRRADLLETAPNDWSDVLALARETKRVVMPMRPTGVWGAFLSICANAGHPAFSPANAFAPEVAADALSKLRDLAGLVDPACFSEYPVALLNRMATGDDIIFMPFTYGYATYGIEGYGSHRLTYGDLPLGATKGGAIMGGAGIGILKNCKAPDLAARHIAWLSSPEVQRGLYTFSGGQPAQRAAWDDPTADAYLNGFFSATRHAAETAYLRPNNPAFHHFQNFAATAVFNCVVGKAGIEKTLASVEEGWNFQNPSRL